MSDSNPGVTGVIDTDSETAAADSSQVDAAGPEAASSADARTVDVPADAGSPRRQLSISVGIRTLVLGLLLACLIGAVSALSWLYFGTQRELDAQASQSANVSHAEKVALDYAVNAAAMNFQDLNAWKVKLVAGTSPELNDKLTKAATSMEQILAPLQWTSTAEPLTAKVRSASDGIYVVDCFVGVHTKTVQAPEALQSTATYSVTLDSNKSWLITDVGGISAVAATR